MSQTKLRNPKPLANWPGYNYPLAFRQLKSSDAFFLYPVIKASANNLKGFIYWAKYVPSWDLHAVKQFVNDHVNDELPRFHLIFTIGYEIVGMGSLAPANHDRNVQISLWTVKKPILKINLFLNLFNLNHITKISRFNYSYFPI